MTDEFTQSDYEREVSSTAESILSETLADNPEADADEVREAVEERLHEAIDGDQNVIYTWRAQLVCAYSANDGYAASNFGAESLVDDCGNLNWSAIAYGAMYADVSEELWPLFDEWKELNDEATCILDELDSIISESVEDIDPALQTLLEKKGITTEADAAPVLLEALILRDSTLDKFEVAGECARLLEAKNDEALRTLLRLADKAKPQTEKEWGSDRQVEAENDFGALLRTVLGAEKWEKFTRYALKATTEERLSYGIALAKGWELDENGVSA
jgi:hypothetical protein